MKLSGILKYAGIVIGTMAGIILVFSVLDLLIRHKIALVFLGLGALIYFIGMWFAKKGK